MSKALRTLDISSFPCLEDNYGILMHDPASGAVASIDAPDAERIMGELDARGWHLTHILNTHWHDDHVGGNLTLKARYGAKVIGPDAERERIPGIDIGVADGASFDFGTLPVTVMATPGHTLGHVVYHLPTASTLFSGDTLFPMGCGRLFEGTAAQMWGSMQSLAALPPETTVYAAHEYTLANARFAASIDRHDVDVSRRLAKVRDLRANGRTTMPFSIADERATNPFMRAGSAEELGRRRRAKDEFR